VKARRPRVPRGRGFAVRLIRWFEENARDLPWRRTRDPYEILVSEVMLQQTQVDRVKQYYGRFLRRYPTVEDLAEAPRAGVMEEWAGLGYYNRARNLHKAARQIVRRHGGRFPRSAKEARGLPGVGGYTAGAVLSFAFNEPAPVLDTNVRRVLARAFLGRPPHKDAAEDRRLAHLNLALIPDGKVWEFNQAVMELGAVICTARNPRCPSCVVRNLCRFYARLQARRDGAARSGPPARRGGGGRRRED
jgi:A/G-specific adenine glycosylase